MPADAERGTGRGALSSLGQVRIAAAGAGSGIPSSTPMLEPWPDPVELDNGPVRGLDPFVDGRGPSQCPAPGGPRGPNLAHPPGPTSTCGSVRTDLSSAAR